ncbi:Mini zinc finger protein 2 [Glycine soja]
MPLRNCLYVKLFALKREHHWWWLFENCLHVKVLTKNVSFTAKLCQTVKLLRRKPKWLFEKFTENGLKDSLYHEEMPAQFLVTNVKYHECRRNHACRDGGYILDGCREFVASGAEGTDSAMTCATCGCHRNYHRREDFCDCPSQPAANGA